MVSLDGRSTLRVVNTTDTPLRSQLLEITNPPMMQKLYALEGEVKYVDVHGAGYLEMWNYFPPVKPGMPEAGYFSRTLGESGDMGKITGTSNWRHFRVPFDRTGASGPPTRLDIRLVLPAQGTVYLSQVKLVEYKGRFANTTGNATGAWWPDWAGGLIGGIGGGVLGCLGSLLAWLAAKGKARGFVMGSAKTLITLGAVSTTAGLLALGLRQPYGVWFMPLLLGVILLGIMPSRLKQYQRRYEDLEARRMAALDA